MAGHEEEDEEATDVRRVSTGAGADGGPDLEPTLENNLDPEPELKPSWTLNGKRSDSDDGDRTGEGPELASSAAGSRQETRTAAPPGCWSKPDLGPEEPRARPDPGESSGIWQWADVGEAGAASVARVWSWCSGFGVRMT